MRHLTRMSRNLSRWGGGFTYLYLSLMLLCFCAIGVKAADINGSVKFNSGVRYSQWAINSRLHDFYGNQKKFGFDYYDNNGTNTKTVTWYKLDGTTKVDRSFDYVAGLVGKASLEAADFYENFEWSKPWFYAAQGYATGTRYANKNMTLDNMNAAKMYFPILAGNLKSPEATTVANTAINAVINDMKTYNSTYVIGSENSALNNTNANDVQKSMFGGWFHKSTDYTDQMWCDGQYMGPALLAQIIKHTGKTTNISDNDWDIIANQFSITWAQLYDKTTGLLYHGFTANPGDNASSSWAGISKDNVYHSASFWGRANAWYFLALVDILEVMPTNNTYYNTFKGYLSNLAKGIANYQDKGTGCWYQVMDKVPASLTGNYLEASCSSIFTAGYLKAIRLGLLDKATYEPIAKKAYEGLVNQFMIYDNKDNSTIQLVHSCTSAGLGGSNKRAGDDNYYLTGKDASVVTSSDPTSQYYYTEGKVLGGFIMAATEYERAYQNQDSKQILFAKDLAPSYDFTTTAGTLDATAYGNGTVSYQWYKDNAKIANATSATYTPKESGNYYCVATANGKSAGGNSIQTSTTTVTTANTDNGSTDNNGGSENGETTTIFSLSVNTGANASVAKQNELSLAEYATITGGSASVYNGKGSAQNMIVNGSITYTDKSTQYVKITLNKALAKGDVITIATSGTKIYAAKDNSGNTTNNIAKSPYTVDDNLAGATVLYLSSGDKGKTISSITITRSVKKYKVSATAGAGGSVSIANAGTTVNSGSEVEENTSLTFTATPNDGYEFVNWTDASNKIVSANATYTTTVSAEISLTANFKAKTTVDPTESGVIYDFTGSIGTTTDGTSCTTANNVITFSSNFSANEGKYITIKPKTGGFKVGDVITLKGYCNSKNLSGVIIYSDVNGSSIFKSNILATSATGSEFTYTIEKDCDALYLGRYGGGTTCLTSLQVKRPASSSKTRLTASFERNADVVVNTTKTATLPALTVKAGETTLTADKDYDVVYKSNAENVATLSGNTTITINSLGIATITATVTPKDANTYEGTTATYQLSVKAPSPLNVSVMDVTINTTDAEEEQPVIKVYGDKDELLKLGQDYTLSYTVSGDKNVTVDNKTGKFSVNKNAENKEFIKGTSLITVTATPTASLGSNYIAGTLQFSYSVSEGKIKPVFLDSFKDITINLHQDDTSRKIIVPLIYNGEDVSSYFIYTYTITPKGNASSVTGSELNYIPSTAGTYTVTVSAKPDPNGTNDYSDVYDNPEPITFTLNVASKYHTISVDSDPKNIQMYAGTTHDAPDLTVQIVDTKQTLGDTEYYVTWFSTSPGVVKVDAKTGKIEAVSEGTANIRVVVTGENLESTTALITVEVDDRALYRVKGPESGETYGNQKRMWNQDNTLSVVLGGWMFPNDGIPDTNILDQKKKDPEKLSKSYQWDTKSGKAKWKLTGFDYYVTCNKNKNARQENGSNALPETTNIYSADFVKYKGTIKDNMFNVPCSGSYLEFNPVTNGKVTVHIFQNGAFDAKTTNKNGTEIKEYQYRPQRRVFVMDEAGNFVESTAHIESTNGKPTGGIQTIDKYKWDLDSKTLTIEDVRHHFNGIPTTFDMTADAFKNNVYESLLDTKIVPNAAANDRKGSHGWSVLADSPVTYTFNVKAGKTYYLYNFGSKIGFYGFSFDEDETKPTVDEVSYADDQSNTITATAAGHVAKVKIARKMVANRWTTCVLPFSLNRQQVDAIFGPAYSAASEEAKNGTQILYFDRVEGNKVFFVRHAYNTIVANKPFLIKPSKEVENISTAVLTDYPYVTIEATKNKNGKPDDWCSANGYAWASSYSNDMTVKEGDGFISNKDGSFKNFVGESGTLKGFRGYLKRLNTQAGAKPMMLQVVSSSNIDGDNGETTGIEDLIIDADGQLMPANNRVYNINGQLVSEDASNFQSLPSGIYIINGKKYIK